MSETSAMPEACADTDENRAIASRLREAAEIMAEQGANPFRVDAYRKAAATLEKLEGPVRRLFDYRGSEGLDALPAIGRGIAGAIAEMLVTGHWAQLQRLRVEIGAAKLSAVRARVLGRQEVLPAAEPPVELLLDIDREYRDKAAAGTLPKIAPRRFNPGGDAWLPVLHETRGAWHFTALYSNTARAHDLGRVHDWVVIYFYDHDYAEGRHTVVTETRGALIGLRVVRGRETECRALYGAAGGGTRAALRTATAG